MRAIIAVLLILMPFTAVADTGAEHGEFTKHKSGTFFMVTAEKHFSIELELAGGELKEGVNTGELIIHDSADKDLKGAKVTVTPWMPGMGHGVPEKAVVTEKEKMFGSTYRLENLVLNMGGHWELLVEIEKDGVKDGAVFDFPAVGGKGMKHGGAMEMHAKPADLDFSPTRASEGKTFTVSYESTPSPPPLNKIHSWRLTVKRLSGEPVTGAMIMVDGGMPAHGHGLPTKPEVTGETAAGIYLLEGMKFTMPGWWEVKFHLTSNKTEDRVTFNLKLK
jgi:hypothetical protein